jgi:hypothetical protein
MAGFTPLDPAMSLAASVKDVCSIPPPPARLEPLSEAGLLMPIGPLEPLPAEGEGPLPGIGRPPPLVGDIAPPLVGVAPSPPGEDISLPPPVGIPVLNPEPTVLPEVLDAPIPCPAPLADDGPVTLLPVLLATWLFGVLLFHPCPARFVKPMLLSALPLP